jgi:hypothetical protein
MVELKRIGGIILIGLALLFAFRIPGHLASSDPHQQSLAHADYFFVFVLGASGLVLLFSPNLKPAGTSQRKKIRPLSIALQGIFLILFCFIFSFRNNVLFAGKIIVPGRVAAVDQPATRPSGTPTSRGSIESVTTPLTPACRSFLAAQLRLHIALTDRRSRGLRRASTALASTSFSWGCCTSFGHCSSLPGNGNKSPRQRNRLPEPPLQNNLARSRTFSV